MVLMGALCELYCINVQSSSLLCFLGKGPM